MRRERERHGFISIFLLGLGAAMSLGAAASPAKQGALGWSDANFWSNRSRLEDKALEAFEASELDGLVLDGPQRAAVRRGRGVPLVAIRGSSLRENAFIDVDERGVLLTSRLEDDVTLAARVFRAAKTSHEPQKLLPRQLPADPSEIPEGHTVKLYRFVLSDQIPEVAARSATWSTTMLLFDRRSNPVVTRVAAKSSRKHRADHAAPSRLLDVASCRARPDSPALADAPSIVLASTNNVEKAPGKAWLLRGSFLLPTLTRDAAPPPGPSDGKQTSVAVLPVSLILTGDSDASPIVVPLRVPIAGPLEGSKDQPLARGYFVVDLLPLVGDQLTPQSYALWAVSRQQFSEPLVIELSER